MTRELFDFEEDISGQKENRAKNKWEIPLADRVRPASIEEFAGQGHLVGEGTALRTLLEQGQVPSCILYGPPGVGKTTLVRLMASMTGRNIMEINAVSAKVSQLRELVVNAEAQKTMNGGRSVIAFVDEIYHFNKGQQNALLPSVEKGDIILVGTTTENPYFEINKTLLSRLIVFEMKPLEREDLIKVLVRALEEERGLAGLDVNVDGEILKRLAAMSGGDARQALNRLEVLVHTAAARGSDTVQEDDLEKLFSGASIRFDKTGDDHYDIISALIKSMRGSDPDASVYWLARLLAGGENLRFITRRLLIFASEDIGLADPGALRIASAAAYAVDMVGYPEAKIILSQAVLYMAVAPKSNSSYMAIKNAEGAIRKGNIQEVPDHLRQGGTGYRYPHDSPGHWVSQKYMKENIRLYFPGAIGAEARIVERIRKLWKRFREEK